MKSCVDVIIVCKLVHARAPFSIALKRRHDGQNERTHTCRHFIDTFTLHALDACLCVAGKELARVAKAFNPGGTTAIVLSCGTGADAVFLLKRFRRVACVEICANAVRLGLARAWKSIALSGTATHVLLVEGGIATSMPPPGMPPAGADAPVLEFYVQDNLALAEVEHLPMAMCISVECCWL